MTRVWKIRCYLGVTCIYDDDDTDDDGDGGDDDDDDDHGIVRMTRV